MSKKDKPQKLESFAELAQVKAEQPVEQPVEQPAVSTSDVLVEVTNIGCTIRNQIDLIANMMAAVAAHTEAISKMSTLIEDLNKQVGSLRERECVTDVSGLSAQINNIDSKFAKLSENMEAAGQAMQRIIQDAVTEAPAPAKIEFYPVKPSEKRADGTPVWMRPVATEEENAVKPIKTT